MKVSKVFLSFVKITKTMLIKNCLGKALIKTLVIDFPFDDSRTSEIFPDMNWVYLLKGHWNKFL